MATNNDRSRQPSAARHRYEYGVDGLTEWQALISAGNARVRIPFTGGTMSGYGCTPARFMTTSHALARIIESSDYFLSGRIRRLN